MNAFVFARSNTLIITCEIRNDQSCRNIRLASGLQARSLRQHESQPMHLRSASMAPCHHHHMSATGMHRMQVRHLFGLHIQCLL